MINFSVLQVLVFEKVTILFQIILLKMANPQLIVHVDRTRINFGELEYKLCFAIIF